MHHSWRETILKRAREDHLDTSTTSGLQAGVDNDDRYLMIMFDMSGDDLYKPVLLLCCQTVL